MYKKIYLEITNNCNLSCPFCIKNERVKEYMSFDSFKSVLERIKPYTNYLYLHVLGEPLLHPNINEFIDYASKLFNVNITTNGYLIDRIKGNHNIRQINISLHSFTSDYKSLDEYLNNICSVIDNLNKYTYFSLRFWVNNEYNKEIIRYLNNRYNVSIKLETGFKVTNNTFISINKEFIWPDLNNDYYNEIGVCYALKDHIGILVNGDVVPCCLDSKGIINLGNIFKNDLSNIINSDRYQNMLNGFKSNKKIEELCKKCNFLE